MDIKAVPEEVASNKATQMNGRVLWKTITAHDYPAGKGPDHAR